MRTKLFLEEFRKNWLIISLGSVFFSIGVFVLNANEGRAFKHHSALRDAFSQAISINDDRSLGGKSRDYEGKLIHYTGFLATQEPIGDSNYNILVQAVKLRKIVEIYQWHEDYTENKFAPDESSNRNYFYYKDWSERLISSQSFHSLAHQNPKKKPMESKIMMAERVFIGNYEICEEAKDKFNTWIDVTSDTKPEDYFIKMHSGAYYHCEDLFDPQIGDMRVRFQLAGLEGDIYTIVGKFNNGQIVPYLGPNQKRKIILLRKGSLSIEDIFHQEHSSLWKELWFSRAFGFLVIMFSVIAMENVYRITFSRTPFSFLVPDPMKQLRSYIKVAAIITAVICVSRQSVHYLKIY